MCDQSIFFSPAKLATLCSASCAHKTILVVAETAQKTFFSFYFILSFSTILMMMMMVIGMAAVRVFHTPTNLDEKTLKASCLSLPGFNCIKYDGAEHRYLCWSSAGCHFWFTKYLVWGVNVSTYGKSQITTHLRLRSIKREAVNRGWGMAGRWIRSTYLPQGDVRRATWT